MYPTADYVSNPAAGLGSGDAMKLMEGIANRELPSTMSFEWSELALQQLIVSNDLLTKLVFPLAVAFVFMVLAAQYVKLVNATSHSVDRAHVLAGRDWRPVDLPIRHQHLHADWLYRADRIGRQERDLDRGVCQTIEKGNGTHRCSHRSLPCTFATILMTSFAFILGVAPLLVGVGAGFEMRKSLGIAVFYGMLGVTAFGLIFTPLFYVLIDASQSYFGHRPSDNSSDDPSKHSVGGNDLPNP